MPGQAGAIGAGVYLVLALLGGNFTGPAASTGTYATMQGLTPNGPLLQGWIAAILGGDLSRVAPDLIVPLAFRCSGRVLDRFKGRPGEPEVKLVLLPLLLLAGLASVAGVAAVLPAYLLGFAMSRSLNERKEAWSKVRTVFLGFMVSLFFLAAGSNVSMEALLAGALFIIALGFGRVLLKMLFVLPTVSAPMRKDRVYVALLMSTSLTFGMVFLQFGLEQGLIDTTQFSLLVGTIIIGALAPTLAAQRWFDPWRGSS